MLCPARALLARSLCHRHHPRPTSAPIHCHSRPPCVAALARVAHPPHTRPHIQRCPTNDVFDSFLCFPFLFRFFVLTSLNSRPQPRRCPSSTPPAVAKERAPRPSRPRHVPRATHVLSEAADSVRCVASVRLHSTPRLEALKTLVFYFFSFLFYLLSFTTTATALLHRCHPLDVFCFSRQRLLFCGRCSYFYFHLFSSWFLPHMVRQSRVSLLFFLFRVLSCFSCFFFVQLTTTHSRLRVCPLRVRLLEFSAVAPSMVCRALPASSVAPQEETPQRQVTRTAPALRGGARVCCPRTRARPVPVTCSSWLPSAALAKRAPHVPQLRRRTSGWALSLSSEQCSVAAARLCGWAAVRFHCSSASSLPSCCVFSVSRAGCGVSTSGVTPAAL